LGGAAVYRCDMSLFDIMALAAGAKIQPQRLKRQLKTKTYRSAEALRHSNHCAHTKALRHPKSQPCVNRSSLTLRKPRSAMNLMSAFRQSYKSSVL